MILAIKRVHENGVIIICLSLEWLVMLQCLFSTLGSRTQMFWRLKRIILKLLPCRAAETAAKWRRVNFDKNCQCVFQQLRFRRRSSRVSKPLMAIGLACSTTSLLCEAAVRCLSLELISQQKTEISLQAKKQNSNLLLVLLQWGAVE